MIRLSGEILMLIGAFIMFSGAFGFFRFRDAFQRFHPPTKASLLGLSLIILGETIVYGHQTGEWSAREFFGILILLFAGPFAAHIVARALYQIKNRGPSS